MATKKIKKNILCKFSGKIFCKLKFLYLCSEIYLSFALTAIFNLIKKCQTIFSRQMNIKYQNVNLRIALLVRLWFEHGTALVRLKWLKGKRDKKLG